jgi:Tfp pilus assembly protein PilN
MTEHHRRGEDGVDPEIAALGRVKLATWRQIIGAFMWLGAVTAGSSATAVAVTRKLDAATYNIQRQDDRDLLAAKLDALDRRLQSIETFQARQAAAAEQAAAIAAVIKAQQN